MSYSQSAAVASSSGTGHYAPPTADGVSAGGASRLSRSPVGGQAWSKKEKVGLGLVIFTLAMLVLATCLSQGVFDKMMYISSSNIAAGCIGLASLFFLIPGLVLLCKPCVENQEQQAHLPRH